MKSSTFFIKYLDFVYGAFLAIILLLLPNLVFKTHLDSLEYLALTCFSAAIPPLCLALTVVFFKKNNPPHFNHDWYDIWKKHEVNVMYIGLGGGFVGIGSIFIHVNIFIGLIFILSVIWCLAILNRCIPAKKNENTPS